MRLRVKNEKRMSWRTPSRSFGYVLWILVIFFSPLPRTVFGETLSEAQDDTPKGAGSKEGPLKVVGQTRDLSSLLSLKTKKDQIQFVKPRRDYRKKILKMSY